MKSPVREVLPTQVVEQLHLLLITDLCPRSAQRITRMDQDHRTNTLFNILPQIGKMMDTFLARGCYHHHLCDISVKRVKGIPIYCYTLMQEIAIYDAESGAWYLVDAKHAQLRKWRTMFYFAYKFDDGQDRIDLRDAAWDSYRARDSRVKTDFSKSELGIFSIFLNRCFSLEGLELDPLPVISSGATADNFNKYERRCTLHPSYFGPLKGGVMSADDWVLYHESVNFALPYLKYRDVGARFTTVPKDTRGPRAISMEPASRLSAQLGIMNELYDWIENYSPARGFVNFTDQSMNQRLAYLGSIDGSYATIDLKDASDLVSNELVKVFPEPLRSLLLGTRSETVSYRDKTMELKKFASMGSALCFPVEAMVFYAIARMYSPVVYVYGDDIIVPTPYAEGVIANLERYGLIVNKDKTFFQGRFRESCGGDYYSGVDVTPVRFRSLDLDAVCAFLTNWESAFDTWLTEELYSLLCSVTTKELKGLGLARIPRFPIEYHNTGAVAYFSKYAKRRPKMYINNDHHTIDIRCITRIDDSESVRGSGGLKRHHYRILSKYGYRVPNTSVTKFLAKGNFYSTFMAQSLYLDDAVERLEFSLTLNKIRRRNFNPLALLRAPKAIGPKGDYEHSRLIWSRRSTTERLW